MNAECVGSSADSTCVLPIWWLCTVLIWTLQANGRFSVQHSSTPILSPRTIRVVVVVVVPATDCASVRWCVCVCAGVYVCTGVYVCAVVRA